MNLNRTLKRVIKSQEREQKKKIGRKTYKNKSKKIKKMSIGTYILVIITLHVNKINAPTKRQRLAE